LKKYKYLGKAVGVTVNSKEEYSFVGILFKNSDSVSVALGSFRTCSYIQALKFGPSKLQEGLVFPPSN
jgi:hypothetical protein